VDNYELEKTLVDTVPFLNNANQRIRNKFRSLVRANLIIKTSNKGGIINLQKIARNFERRMNFSKVGGLDLSLLQIALENVRKNEKNEFIIVTNDDAFRKFISHIHAKKELLIDGIKYKTSNINGVTLLTYLTHTFKCCNYKELKELRYDILFRQSKIPNDRVRERKVIDFLDWIDRVYIPAFNIKKCKI